jgi:hypothetical protein
MMANYDIHPCRPKNPVSADQIVRVASLEEWVEGTEAVQANELLGCVMDSFAQGEVDLEAEQLDQYLRIKYLKPEIIPPTALELAIIATNNSTSKPFRVRPDQSMSSVQALREDSPLHHDGVRGLRVSSLVSHVTLQGKARAHLKRAPTFRRSKLKTIVGQYVREDGTVDSDALAADFTPVDLNPGDVLAFSAAGNRLSHRYPVLHYFETVESPRLSVPIGDFSFEGRMLNLKARVAYHLDHSRED